MLKIHGWTIPCGGGSLGDLEVPHFHFCEKVQTPKVPGRLEALSH